MVSTSIMGTVTTVHFLRQWLQYTLTHCLSKDRPIFEMFPLRSKKVICADVLNRSSKFHIISHTHPMNWHHKKVQQKSRSADLPSYRQMTQYTDTDLLTMDTNIAK